MASDWLDRIHWSTDGLIPVVTQEAGSGRVLTVAWANREALQLTAETLEAHYWSRSRKKLWRKGEESGHVQKVRLPYRAPQLFFPGIPRRKLGRNRAGTERSEIDLRKMTD